MTTRLFHIPWALSLALLALPLRAAEPDTDVLDPLEAITAKGIREKVSFLAGEKTWGRRAGTDGARVAREYIARVFREAGLVPGGRDGSYFQPVKVPAAVIPREGNGLKILGNSRSFALKPNRDFVPFGFTGSSRTTAKVVFAGYGISAPEKGWDDYAGIDVKGKIVLVLRYGPGGKFKDRFSRRSPHTSLNGKAKAAEKRGAAGVILVNGTGGRRRSDRLAYLGGGRDPVSIPCLHASARIGNALVGLLGESLEARQKKIEALGKPLSEAIPRVRVEMAAAVCRGESTCYNVVGLLPGCDPDLKAECIVIGGHYDHLGYGDIGAMTGQPGAIFHGADDNASGTTGVMECAVAFGSLPYKPRRSIVFVAFAAEEAGLLGSFTYAKSPLFPPARTAAMLNLDMIGRLRSGRLTVQGVGTGDVFRSILGEANRSVGLNLTLAKRAYPGSDHTPFYGKKIPSLFFMTGIHPEYHKPADTVATLNIGGMVRVTRLLFLTAAKLASMDGRPAFQSQTPARGIAGDGGRPRLGGAPDRDFKGPGARLAEVSSGTPAAKAGLRAGDVIVEFAGKPVKGLRDLYRILFRLKPGSEAKVVYLREGKKKSARIRFEK